MLPKEAILAVLVIIVYFVIVESQSEDDHRKHGVKMNFKLKYAVDNRGKKRLRKVTEEDKSELLKGYVYYKQGDGYFKLYQEEVSWNDARLKCEEAGAELASPETDNLLRVMASVIMTNPRPPKYVFTGISDLYSKGIFHSLRGVRLEDMATGRSFFEPYNIDHEHNCLSFHRNGMLSNSKCTAQAQYICYKRSATLDELRCTDLYKYNTKTQACYKYYSVPATWSEAYATCYRDGGHLMVVNSGAEAGLDQHEEAGNNTEVFVGATYWNGSLYMTIFGYDIEEAGYAEWAPNQPTAGSDKQCVVLAERQLAVRECTKKLPFVCELNIGVKF